MMELMVLLELTLTLTLTMMMTAPWWHPLWCVVGIDVGVGCCRGVSVGYVIITQANASKLSEERWHSVRPLRRSAQHGNTVAATNVLLYMGGASFSGYAHYAHYNAAECHAKQTTRPIKLYGNISTQRTNS